MYSAWNPKDNYDMSANVFVAQFNGFVTHKLVWSTDINITDTDTEGYRNRNYKPEIFGIYSACNYTFIRATCVYKPS